MLKAIKTEPEIKLKVNTNYVNTIGPVAIIGAGICGASLAYALRKRNIECYILEKTSCNHNGMMKHMQRLKKIINICIKQRYINHNPFDGFSINFKRSNRVFLSNDELQSLTDVSLRKSLSKIRDIFLCSCYTGLSYVDIKKLSRKNIRKGNDGFMWIFCKSLKSTNV